MEPVCPSPPPSGMEQSDAHQQPDAPWKILDPVWCGPLARMSFIDGAPACVDILRCSTRSFSWSEARLKLEVAEVRRLLASGATSMREEQRSGVTDEVLAGLSQELRNIDLAALASKGLRRLQRMVRGDDDPPDFLTKTVHSMRNILVLSCALELSEEHFAQMGSQGMPTALKERISSVLLREYSMDEIEDVIARVGVAKQHLFNPGVHFSRRARKKDKPARPIATPSTI